MPGRKCIKCGQSLLNDSLFCHVCGAQRQKCSCGAFIDAGMKFCAECGKPTEEGLLWKEENDKLNKKIEKLNKEFAKVEEEEKKVAEEEKKIAEENEKIRKEHEKKVEECAKKLGIRTGMTEDELKYNFIDKGWYVELVHPIGRINMIEKCWTKNPNFDSAQDYAKNLRLGGFTDWRIPSINELEIIYKIKDFLGINAPDGIFWSSTECQVPKRSWFETGEMIKTLNKLCFDDGSKREYDRGNKIICVR